MPEWIDPDPHPQRSKNQDLPAGRVLPAARARHLISGALIGRGALAITAGGALLDLGTQGGPNDKYRYVGATPAGVVIGVAGAATLAAGTCLWWRTPASSAPTVGITSSGAAVAGWTAAF